MNATVTFLQSTLKAMPMVILALLALVAGLCLAQAMRFLVTRLLKILHFRAFSARVGLLEFLRKGEVTYSPVELVGMLVYWGTLAWTLFWISSILKLEVVRALSAHLQSILPSACLALLTVALGLMVVTFLAKFARTLARNAGLPNATALARGIHYAGVGIVIALAVEQLGLGKTILGPMLLMAFGAVVFGVALAFGLGCKDLASQAMTRFIRNLKEQEDGPKGGDMEG